MKFAGFCLGMLWMGLIVSSPEVGARPEVPSLRVAADDSTDIWGRVSQAEERWKAGDPDCGFLTAGSAIQYGLGYLKTGKFEESLGYFSDAIRIDPNSAYARFFLGLAQQGAGHSAEAQRTLAEAVRLDPALQTLVSVSPARTPSTDPAPQVSDKSTAVAGTDVRYRVGDPVEVFYAGQWNPGRLTSVEGSGSSVYVYADFSFSGETRTGSFFANGVRPAKASPPAEKALKVGSGLIYGDYVCTLDRWDVGQKRMVHDQKGYFRLNPDGTYRYLDGGEVGRYRYDPGTQTIQWLSGYFADAGPSTTKYTPGTKVAQIDITFHTPSGDLYWSAGCNK